MGITIDQFAAECREILQADPGPDGQDKVRARLEDVLLDEEFVATHLGSDADSQRNILYEDPDLGFCIIAHVYKGAKGSNPHDHGPSWAIYGQAKGVTEMTDWKLLERPKDGKPGKVEKVRSYDLTPGMARAYDVGVLHSPRREGETRLIRIEGKNMAKIDRDAFEVA